MDLGAAVVADEQPFELVEVREGALDDPSHATEAGALLGLAARDLGVDAQLAELPTVLVVVVAAVGGDGVRSVSRPAALAAHAWYPFDQRDQLGDVVAVAARNRPGERDPAGVDQEMVLGAVSGSINWARARFGAPFFACT